MIHPTRAYAREKGRALLNRRTPEIMCSLLMYRYRRIDEARAAAAAGLMYSR